MNWLVTQLNKQERVSRQHVSRMMNGKAPMSEEWERRINDLFDHSF